MDGKNTPFEIPTYMLDINSSINILYGTDLKYKNEILIDKTTARNLVYEYYLKNELDTNQVFELTDEEIFSFLKNKDITFFTEHSEDGENRYETIYNYGYLKPLSTKIVTAGIVDDKIISSYFKSNNKIGDVGYYPIIFVLPELYYEIRNQYIDYSADYDIMEYFRPSIFLSHRKYRS